MEEITKEITKEMIKEINEVLEKEVRPYLSKHQGNVSICSFEKGVLTLRLEGQCSQCASASDTVSYIIEKPLLQKFPIINSIELDTSLSDEMLALAKAVLSGKTPFTAPLI